LKKNLSAALSAEIELLLPLSVTALTLGFVFLPYLNETILRPIIGIAFIFFVPGYVLVAALFPAKKAITLLERAGLSFGLSIAICPLVALFLNYTSYGVVLEPLLVGLAAVTLASVLLAVMRRRGLPPDERFSFSFRNVYEFAHKAFPRSDRQFDRALAVALVCLVVIAAGVLSYVVFAPRQGETYSALYILGPDGKAGNYPTQFSLGEKKPVIVGVVNHEQRDANYNLVITLNGTNQTQTLYSQKMTLTNNQTQEQTIYLKPDLVGNNMRIDFSLYLDNGVTPYRTTWLWVTVS
jgi:uncharacterized membrane protein